MPEPLANLTIVGGHEDDPAFGDGLRAKLERARLAREPQPAETTEISADSGELHTPTPDECSEACKKPAESTD